jgi:hypothetical protein
MGAGGEGGIEAEEEVRLSQSRLSARRSNGDSEDQPLP